MFTATAVWCAPFRLMPQDADYLLTAIRRRRFSAFRLCIQSVMGNIADDVLVMHVRAYSGGISVTQPDGDIAMIYTIDGRHVATVSGSGSAVLASGIYVVRSEAHAVKVVVP